MASQIEKFQNDLMGNLAAENANGGSEPQAVFDPTLIVTIITSIFDVISKCRGGTAAGIQQVKAGGPRVERITRQRLIQEQYGSLRAYRQQGGERVLKATLKTMQNASEEELQAAAEEQKGDMADAGVNYDFA